MIPEVFRKVTGKLYRTQNAILNGYERFKLSGESYPAIIRKTDATTEGIIYFDISATDFEKLDHFEGDLYKKVNAPVHAKNQQVVNVILYVLKDGNELLLSQQKWDKSAFIDFELKQFLETDSGFENG